VRSTVRYKLLALVLFPILLIMPAALAFAVYWGTHFGYSQLFIKVNADLSVAHDAFVRIQRDYLDEVSRLAESFDFRNDLAASDTAAVRRNVSYLRERAGFSFLHLIAPNRTWLHEDREAVSRHSDIVTQALQGNPGSGIEIFSAEDLTREGLAERVRLSLVPTPRAAPSDRRFEDRGMMIRVAYPVRTPAGDVAGVLDGGVLLNGNFRFVDTIRDLVYGKGSLPVGGIGTVTVFLDDVRISTNVPLRPGERALGTRVSRQVRTQVLERGDVWVNRAFVVNDWYISAYEPIFDLRGQRVGMLYAGFLEAPFRQELWQAFWTLAGLFLILMVSSAVLAVIGAKRIFVPVEAMARVVAATRSGADRRVGALASRDELGELARELDGMLDLLQQRNQQIRQAADQLELKVEQRTAELQRRNAELSRTIDVLRQTRRALVEAEKLAALGELTAGVAHEINNPTAVILGNIDVLTAELGPQLDPVREEIKLIVEQIYRIKDIINNLLQYARPAEFAGHVEEVDVNRLIADTLRLVQHLIRNTSIRLELDTQAVPQVSLNPQELQQVLVNLTVNAIHAVEPDRGLVRIATRAWEDRGVCIVVSDNGAGIAPGDLDKVFNPFFSTKQERQGTGLGLSISYSLVRRYGGRITVRSEPGKGAEFTVWLLAKPEYHEDAETITEQLADLREVSSDGTDLQAAR
jgi:two-component system NtrC family sensor kinase